MKFTQIPVQLNQPPGSGISMQAVDILRDHGGPALCQGCMCQVGPCKAEALPDRAVQAKIGGRVLFEPVPAKEFAQGNAMDVPPEEGQPTCDRDSRARERGNKPRVLNGLPQLRDTGIPGQHLKVQYLHDSSPRSAQFFIFLSVAMFTNRKRNITVLLTPARYGSRAVWHSKNTKEDLHMIETFGQRVRRLRQERRWSQQELSLRSGISTPHISSIERGKRFPSLDYAIRLADALGVSLTALCDQSIEFRPPRMLSSVDELPQYLQSFILKEEAVPYLETAHRMSALPAEDANFIRLIVELLVQKHRLRYPDPAKGQEDRST
jgi:transcriptional regulator with XRE-family HTH domain